MNQEEEFWCPFMKTESEKQKKLQHTKSSSSKPVCGTLSYLAECRGTVKKTGIFRTAPPGEPGRIIRRYPAAQ